jgi:hypothetical protein
VEKRREATKKERECELSYCVGLQSVWDWLREEILHLFDYPHCACVWVLLCSRALSEHLLGCIASVFILERYFISKVVKLRQKNDWSWWWSRQFGELTAYVSLTSFSISLLLDFLVYLEIVWPMRELFTRLNHKLAFEFYWHRVVCTHMLTDLWEIARQWDKVYSCSPLTLFFFI